MNDNMKNDSYDDISEMIEDSLGTAKPASPETMIEAMRALSESNDEEMSKDLGIQRYHTLGSYKLDVIRNGSDEYFQALADALVAISVGEYGSIEYKGYKIYYTDAPHIKSISLEDGHKEYYCEFCLRCDALRLIVSEEYHSGDERKSFLDPNSDNFKKTLTMLDTQIQHLDDGRWIRQKKTLNIYDFKDYSPKDRKFKIIEWDDRNKDANDTLLFLIEDALARARGLTLTEDDFEIYSDVIRRMVFFADYGKRNFLFELQGFVSFKWKPKTKRDKYIWLCMNEFGQGDLPDTLLDNCSLYYFLNDPRGWEALAYLLPIEALWKMCQDYEPDDIKYMLLAVFDHIPNKGFKERIEKLIEADRAKAKKGESKYDPEDD